MSEPQHDEADLPVLTEVVEERPPEKRPPDALEALARDIEREVLSRLAPEMERIVREAVAAALAQARGEPPRT